MRKIISRLKNPSVILGLTSNIVSLALLLGYKLNESLILSAVTILCSMLVLLGILSNPDDNTDNRFYCPVEKERTLHVEVASRKVCSTCGNRAEV